MQFCMKVVGLERGLCIDLFFCKTLSVCLVRIRGQQLQVWSIVRTRITKNSIFHKITLYNIVTVLHLALKSLDYYRFCYENFIYK